MGERISFRSADGVERQGFLARAAPGAPGVVVLHEWWGLDEMTERTCEKLAAAGFSALAPDLYGAPPTKSPVEARALLNGLTPAHSRALVEAAARHLRAATHAHDVAVLGFCMGGAHALIAATHVKGLKAAVCFYGLPPKEAADPGTIRIPVLLHFAQIDDWCTPEAVQALQTRLLEGRVAATLHRYPAQHAFVNERRPEVYDPTQAELALSRTWDFLREQLT